jgi:hypothetical protein
MLTELCIFFKKRKKNVGKGSISCYCDVVDSKIKNVHTAVSLQSVCKPLFYLFRELISCIDNVVVLPNFINDESKFVFQRND